jgi:hypothetical protein
MALFSLLICYSKLFYLSLHHQNDQIVTKLYRYGKLKNSHQP